MKMALSISVELDGDRLKLKTPVPIKVGRVKVKKEFPLYVNSVVLTYESSNNIGRIKSANLKCPFGGTVGKVFVETNATVNDGDTLMQLRICSHSVRDKDVCADCGAHLEESASGFGPDAASVSMIHHMPHLRVSEELSRSIGRDDELRLLTQKKLVLLVDLDQTLIHTTSEPVYDKIKGVHHFRLPSSNNAWYHTRIRPGTEDFLRKISQLFELHIVTFGARPYANHIASLLDPGKKYFQYRILSRDECFNPQSKTANLKSLFPCGDQMVCIIDDREDVWNFASNLIAVKPYVFFRGAGDINAPAGLLADCHALPASEGGTCSTVLSHRNPEALRADREVVACLQGLIEHTCGATDGFIDYEDTDDYLLHLEDSLRTVHRAYFELYEQMKHEKHGEASSIPDLKTVIPYVRQKVLKDVVIVFTGCFPINQRPESAKIFLVAVSLGAKVQKELSKEVTHLVAARPGTAKVQQARKFRSIKVVSPDWLWSCAERWEKSSEALFPLKDVPVDAGKWRARGGVPERAAKPEDGEADFLREEMLKLSRRKMLPEALVPSLVTEHDALAEMLKEVDDELADDDDDDDGEEGDEDEHPLKKMRFQ
ncbi:RNA polymerase II subunit A C-terminal domain phosphatase [Galendromus occidentalis]|uniref:RNA polymerase II subunit A C-terminal domain phosphatase n=1 Tax=Galendromus occidentalis TaxID=34638 RepID=A0AAJ7L703_9ACAR|nr:RNA polymerase II subunit A C-terminal domain phosphatase [Galendromus occidentalis]